MLHLFFAGYNITARMGVFVFLVVYLSKSMCQTQSELIRLDIALKITRIAAIGSTVSPSASKKCNKSE